MTSENNTMSEVQSNSERGEDGMPTPPRAPRDVIVGGVILVLSTIIYAITLTFKEAPASIAMNMQPSSFPRMIIILISMFSVWMMVLAYRRRDKIFKPIPMMSIISAGVMIGFVGIFSILGIIPAMVLLCFFLPVIWGERRWKIIIPYCILFPAAVYMLFAVLLNVHFDASPLALW